MPNVEMVVCGTCHRQTNEYTTNEPATGAQPTSYVPATVSPEESNGEVTLYVALHQPGCWRIGWAKG